MLWRISLRACGILGTTLLMSSAYAQNGIYPRSAIAPGTRTVQVETRTNHFATPVSPRAPSELRHSAGYSPSGFPHRPVSRRDDITLRLPLDTPGAAPIEYQLDGHIYTMRPGEAQTFPYDRPWAIYFPPTPDSQVVRGYALLPGTFKFVNRDGQWDLVQAFVPGTDLPPRSRARRCHDSEFEHGKP